MKKLIITSLTLMLLVGMLLAQKPPLKEMQAQNMKDDPMMSCMQEMKLTDAQMKKFEELKTGFTKIQNTTEAEIENMQIDMHAALKAEKFTEAKALNKQLFAKKNMLADVRIDFMAARMKELTPDQKEIMKKNMAEFQGGRHMMNGKGMMHGQGMMNRKGRQGDDCTDCGDGHGKNMQHNQKAMQKK
ncbi:MAG: hypothetical protein RBS43_06310 [Candidatus Cloacimonas sp.]|jgi:hypothetical protein|nr:hypothetical protein [Candidatus Cloacimonas sp.]